MHMAAVFEKRRIIWYQYIQKSNGRVEDAANMTTVWLTLSSWSHDMQQQRLTATTRKSSTWGGFRNISCNQFKFLSHRTQGVWMRCARKKWEQICHANAPITNANETFWSGGIKPKRNNRIIGSKQCTPRQKQAACFRRKYSTFDWSRLFGRDTRQQHVGKPSTSGMKLAALRLQVLQMMQNKQPQRWATLDHFNYFFDGCVVHNANIG